MKALKLLNNKDACDEVINSLLKSGYEKFDDLKIDLAIANEQKIIVFMLWKYLIRSTKRIHIEWSILQRLATFFIYKKITNY